MYSKMSSSWLTTITCKLDFAAHVVAVSEDDQLFASYFWWRNYYRATPCKDRYGMEIACHKSTFTEVTTVFVKLILFNGHPGLL